MVTLKFAPQDGPVIVWDEHPDFVLAAKPAGMSFHSEGEVPGMIARLKALPGFTDLHGVHRLDRITSGLLLCARRPEVAAEFGRMFEAGAIRKYYLALADHKPLKKQGWIRGAMEKARGGNWRLAREGAVWAATQFFSYSVSPGLRLYVVRPQSGRTHQIRVALKSIGAPIIGDVRYGGTPSDRGYLHAYALSFTWQGCDYQFAMPPAQGALFAQASEAMPQEPCNLDWPVS